MSCFILHSDAVGPFANEAARHSGENALRCIFNEVGSQTREHLYIPSTPCGKIKVPANCFN